MGTIKSGLNQFVYNGDNLPLAGVSWLQNVRVIYRITDTRQGWVSFVPGQKFNSFTELELDRFYYVEAVRDFLLPDAQITSCGTGSTSATIPDGLSQFVFHGPDLILGATLGNATGIFTINPSNSGWLSWNPNQPFNSVTRLTQGVIYYITASASFLLEGAQIVGCEETRNSENINGALYVKYTDLRGALDPDGVESPKTAPDMVLFADLYNAFQNHNHDTRYYQKTETYTRAEIDLFLQGVEEVQEYANLAAFPPTGVSSTLYIDAQYDVGYRWNGTGYSPISSPGVDLTPYLTIANANATYAFKGDAYTKTESDNRYQFKGSYLTPTDAANLYQPKGNYQLAGNYAKSVSVNFGTPQTPNTSGNINLNIGEYLFTNILENQVGTHPAFTDQHTLNLYLLGRVNNVVVPPVTNNKFDYTLNFKVA